MKGARGESTREPSLNELWLRMNRMAQCEVWKVGEWQPSGTNRQELGTNRPAKKEGIMLSVRSNRLGITGNIGHQVENRVVLSKY